jgi:hypothetical protein
MHLVELYFYIEEANILKSFSSLKKILLKNIEEFDSVPRKIVTLRIMPVSFALPFIDNRHQCQ